MLRLLCFLALCGRLSGCTSLDKARTPAWEIFQVALEHGRDGQSTPTLLAPAAQANQHPHGWRVN